MKIHIINPDYGVGQRRMDQECRLLKKFVSKDVELSMECLTKTPVEINGPADIIRAGPEILELAKRAEKEGADAVAVYCFSDPAVEALREILSIPVVGAAEASCALIPLRMRKAGIILADPDRICEKELFLRTVGVAAERIGFVDSVDLHGKSAWIGREDVLRELIADGKRLKNLGADGLVLGCTSFLGLAAPISAAVHVPVIDSAVAVVSVAESLVRMNGK